MKQIKTLIFTLLLASICMTCKKANNDEEYRKLIVGRWVHFEECSNMFSLDACNVYYTFYSNGYYTKSPTFAYFNYYFENRHLFLSNETSYVPTDGIIDVFVDYEIKKLKISPFSNRDLKLKNTETGEELNLKYNGK